jgi:hypothetical protein
MLSRGWARTVGSLGSAMICGTVLLSVVMGNEPDPIFGQGPVSTGGGGLPLQLVLCNPPRSGPSNPIGYIRPR